MEYQLKITGHLSDEAILTAVRAFLKPPSGLPRGYFPDYEPILITIPNPVLPRRHTTLGTTQAGKPTTIKPPPNPFARKPVSQGIIGPHIEFTQRSTWGGTNQYYFLVSPTRMLSVRAGSWQHRWTMVPPGWHQPIMLRVPLMPTLRAAPVAKSVAQMSHTERLEEAMLRSIHRLPNHLLNAAKEVFTPANIIIFVGLTIALMASGIGEVLGLGLLVIGAIAGGLDLCINVLRMLVDFYHKAINAQTDADLDEAADLFAAALTRGGIDIIDIVIGRRAAGKLAGRGLRGFGEYFAYLEQEMKLWRGRQVNNGASSQQIAPVEEPPKPASKAKPVAKSKKPAKLVAGTPEHKAQRWKDYQAKGGKYSYEKWSKQYETNMQNAKVGLSREAEYRDSMGGTSETVKTPYTNRQVDVSIQDQDYMGQIKTGKVSLTEQAKIDIQKDAYLVKKGKTVEYILEKGASKPFLKALDDNGIKYKIGPQLPK